MPVMGRTTVATGQMNRIVAMKPALAMILSKTLLALGRGGGLYNLL